MECGKIYREWVTFLKKKGIYVQYMREYARTIEMISFKHYLLGIGQYFSNMDNVHKVRHLNHKFFNCKDPLIPDKSDRMSFDNLRSGVRMLVWYRSDWDERTINKIDWIDIVLDFGTEYGYYKEPIWDDTSNKWCILESPGAESASTLIENYRSITNPRANTRYEDAHTGQWYDRYYNSGRNNNRNNIRWRR